MSVRSGGRRSGTVRSVSGASLRSGSAPRGGPLRSVARRSSQAGSRISVSTAAEFGRAKGNNSIGEVLKPAVWSNAPGHVRGKGEFHEPCVMKALSTRFHSTGKDYTMITGQKPADSAVVCVDYEDEDPNLDITSLRGGSGEPVYVAIDGVREGGPASKLGICEGFELAAITYLGEAEDETLQLRRVPVEVTNEVELKEVMGLLTEDLRFKKEVPSGTPLGGASGISELDQVCPVGPMLGIKSLAQMKNLNLPVTLMVRRGFQSLPAAEIVKCLVLQEDQEGHKVPVRLGFVSPLSGVIAFSGRQCGQRFGVTKIKEVHCLRFVEEVKKALEKSPGGMVRNDAPTAVFEGCLSRSGLLWLAQEEKQALSRMVDSNRWNEEEMKEENWMERVSDLIVFGRLPESLQAGAPPHPNNESGGPPLKRLSPDAFMNVNFPIQRQHIKDLTELLEKQQREKMTSEGITEKDFRQAVFMAGITWLTWEQVSVLFKALDAGGDGGVSMTEWSKQFRWEPAEAAAEVERSLQNYFEAQKKEPPEEELDFDEFCDLLFEAGVTWLTTEQKKILFDTIDEDKSGKVSQEEWKKIGQLRVEMEAKMEAKASGG